MSVNTLKISLASGPVLRHLTDTLLLPHCSEYRTVSESFYIGVNACICMCTHLTIFSIYWSDTSLIEYVHRRRRSRAELFQTLSQPANSCGFLFNPFKQNELATLNILTSPFLILGVLGVNSFRVLIEDYVSK